MAESALGQSDEQKYSYGSVKTLDEAITKEGLINVRLEFKAMKEGEIRSMKGKISVRKGEMIRIKEYFFEVGEDLLDGAEFNISASNQKTDVIALWISEATPDTEIRIKGKGIQGTFKLQELVENPEHILELNHMHVTANLLLDREIGEINPSDFNANDPGDAFRFAVLADPQGGDPEEEGNHPTRMKIHNAWIEETITQTNIVNPVATLILGDIVDGQGQERNFVQMAEYFKKLRFRMVCPFWK